MKTIAKSKSAIVETNSGKIQGYIDNGLQIFKGIPYTAPPIDELRFSPPKPAEPWNGVLDATNFGPFPLQGASALEMFLGRASPQSEENCLTLNIWTPSTDDADRPVMFWIHGGGFINGGSSVPVYDGLNLAKRGNIVIVTINYRLGALGYLYIPDVTANVGQLDQIAALRWVHENIANFGGNPKNVTIFGESAGGEAVVTLLAMPAAKGLFQHVISQSGPMIYDASAGKKSSDRLMSLLNIEEGDIDSLRKVPAKKIIRAQNKITNQARIPDLIPFCPRIDGKTLPKHPLEVLRSDSANNADLIIGSNETEMKLFTVLDPRMSKMDADGMRKYINAIANLLGQDEKKADELINLYKEIRKDLRTPLDIMDVIGTDFVFRIPAIRISEAHHTHQPNTYNYLFTWPSPAFNGQFGACHAVEIPFVFGTINAPMMDQLVGKGPAADTLKEKIMDTWIAFARDGNPNHDGIPKWPSYDAEKRATMLMGKKFEVVNALFDAERAAWDNVIYNI